MNAGLVDEFSIPLSSVLFGTGIRLFEGVDAGRVALEPIPAEVPEPLSLSNGERSAGDHGGSYGLYVSRRRVSHPTAPFGSMSASGM